MAITETLTVQLTRGSESISKSISLSGEGAVDVDVTVNNGQTDKEVAVAFDKDNLSLILITSDKAITVQTNDGTSPDDTFTLAADKPFLWYTGCGWDNPFSADVTALFLTNASGGTATVRIRVLGDATP